MKFRGDWREGEFEGERDIRGLRDAYEGTCSFASGRLMEHDLASYPDLGVELARSFTALIHQYMNRSHQIYICINHLKTSYSLEFGPNFLRM